MTPEEIQQAREVARETVNPGAWFTPGHAWIALMARAVLALTEQQPEPSRDEITDMFEAEFVDAPTYVVVEHLMARYSVTARPVVSSPDGDSR